MTKTRFFQNYCEKAIDLVVTSQYCSTSFIMRKLGLDYETANLLIEFMDESGIIDSNKGPYTRKVLVK